MHFTIIIIRVISVETVESYYDKLWVLKFAKMYNQQNCEVNLWKYEVFDNITMVLI